MQATRGPSQAQGPEGMRATKALRGATEPCGDLRNPEEAHCRATRGHTKCQGGPLSQRKPCGPLRRPMQHSGALWSSSEPFGRWVGPAWVPNRDFSARSLRGLYAVATRTGRKSVSGNRAGQRWSLSPSGRRGSEMSTIFEGMCRGSVSQNLHFC